MILTFYKNEAAAIQRSASAGRNLLAVSVGIDKWVAEAYRNSTAPAVVPP
jgi:hypothetical protein